MAVLAATVVVGGCEPEMPEVVLVHPAPPGLAPVDVRLSPGNVAALALAANAASLRRAEVAEVRAADPRVRAYASHVRLESGKIGAEARRQLRIFGVTPVAETTARQLEGTATVTVRRMQDAAGLEVDRIYLDAEVAESRWQVELLDAIVAGTTDARLRSELEAYRFRLDARAREAERLHAEIGTP